MSYMVCCVELDGPWGGHEDCRSEVCGGFDIGPFETLSKAKEELDNVLREDHYVDGVVVDTDTNRQLTYLHGSYLF